MHRRRFAQQGRLGLAETDLEFSFMVELGKMLLAMPCKLYDITDASITAEWRASYVSHDDLRREQEHGYRSEL